SLTMAQVVDPTSGISTDIIGTILQLTCFMIFVLNDAHLVLIKMMYQSFAILPLNPSAWLTRDLFSDVVQLLQRAYEWGIRLAAPAIAVAFLLDLSLGLMSRMAPNFDILFMSLPIRLFAGLFTFGMILRYGGPFFSYMCEFTEGFCSRILLG
ncbi:MAG: flagellar biosynthetic protein FliR, partial [bacterium]